MAESFDDAFPALYRQARALALRLSGDHDVADDVASEALARALVRWSTVSRLSYRDAWVMRVATNLSLDHLRRGQRTGRVQIALDQPTTIETENVILRLSLVAALSELPARQREAIVLVHLAGFSPTDAARSMRISASSVTAHLGRGLARLRLTFDDAAIDQQMLIPEEN